MFCARRKIQNLPSHGAIVQMGKWLEHTIWNRGTTSHSLIPSPVDGSVRASTGYCVSRLLFTVTSTSEHDQS
jgi:hypothetical protein